jgi:beta-xylosidase
MKRTIIKRIMVVALSVVTVLTEVQITAYAEVRLNSIDCYVNDLSVNIEDKNLYIGGPEEFGTLSIGTKVEPENADQKVNYKSSDLNVVTVDSNGQVKAKTSGTAKVEVTTNGLKKNGKPIIKHVSIKVRDFVNPKGISLECDNRVIKNGDTTSVLAKVLPSNATDTSYSFKSSDTSLATVDSKGIVKANTNGITGVVTITAIAAEPDREGNQLKESVDITVNPNPDVETVNKISNVGIHDPSIFQDPVSGRYYSYGTHIIAAKSNDAVSWNYIANSQLSYKQGNNLFDKWYVDEFRDIYKWLFSYSEDDISKIISGQKADPQGIWAIDVTYSKAAKDAGNDPYLMYVTVCNGAWKSAIVLCTSNNPEEGFKYKDTIVCSDYTAAEVDAGNTNLLKVLDLNTSSEVRAKYGDYYFPNGFRSSGAQVPDCIDPHPYFDQNQNLYMTYGSFTCYGGVRVLKLDPSTGGRSKENYEYKTTGSEVMADPYFGTKIANKYGEGPYVFCVKDTTKTSQTGYYYFLFYSQGNLNPYGGYNMRMMRSEYADRGFVDYAGNSSLTTSVPQTNLGVRIMDNYKFSFMDYASTANGGNSAMVTSDGRILLQYHSKSNDGTYGFVVKNQQMFLNQEGWLVTTPFRYKGETLASIAKNQILGDYEFIYHRLSYTNTGSVTNKFDYVDSVVEKLNSDGTISGAYAGQWSYDESNNYITITIGSNQYKGVVLEQRMDDTSNTKTIVFGGDGKDNRTVWGSKIVKTEAERAKADMDKLSLSATLNNDFKLNTTGFFGSNITWRSDNAAITIDGANAKVVCQDYDTKVRLTATVTYGSTVLTKNFDVTVSAEQILIDTVIRSAHISLPYKTAVGKTIIWTSSNPSVISSDGTVVQPQTGNVSVTLTGKIENSDKALTFEVTVLPSTITKYFYTQNYEDVTSVSSVWTSPNAQSNLSLATDADHGKYVKFAPGALNSRGASSTFNLNEAVTGAYTVEFDCALTPGNDQETDFALIGKDCVYTGNSINNGISSGYILKFAAINSATWTINDGKETVTLPSGGWVHVTAVISTTTGKVILTIKDNNTTYYQGTLTINGSGSLNGMYIRAGRYQSITNIDNIKVY